MAKKQKYYVVWKGVSPGVYHSWTDCQLQIKGYEGALYKSFDTREEAEQAFASSAFHYVGKNAVKKEETPRQLYVNRHVFADIQFFCYLGITLFFFTDADEYFPATFRKPVECFHIDCKQFFTD